MLFHWVPGRYIWTGGYRTPLHLQFITLRLDVTRGVPESALRRILQRLDTVLRLRARLLGVSLEPYPIFN